MHIQFCYVILSLLRKESFNLVTYHTHLGKIGVRLVSERVGFGVGGNSDSFFFSPGGK